MRIENYITEVERLDANVGEHEFDPAQVVGGAGQIVAVEGRDSLDRLDVRWHNSKCAVGVVLPQLGELDGDFILHRVVDSAGHDEFKTDAPRRAKEPLDQRVEAGGKVGCADGERDSLVVGTPHVSGAELEFILDHLAPTPGDSAGHGGQQHFGLSGCGQEQQGCNRKDGTHGTPPRNGSGPRCASNPAREKRATRKPLRDLTRDILAGTHVAYTIAVLASILFALIPGRVYATVTQDGNGWTVVTASGDSRIIYVSSSDGNDADDGLSSGNAKLTIAAGVALMRSGYPDHLLLKRGDSFTTTAALSANGRSADEPAYFGTYGTGDRPIIDSGDYNGIQTTNKSFIAVIGWHLEPTRVNMSADSIGMWFLSPGGSSQWVLVEDCYVRGYAGNIAFSGAQSDSTVRRCVILESYSTTAHSQGLYVPWSSNVLIEENFLDHNGWNEGVSGAEATIFNHNMYLTHFCTSVTIRNNIISRGSSMGLKFQPVTGTHYITNNLFIRNGYAAQVGGGQPASQAGTSGATIYCNGNVFCEGTTNTAGSPGYGVTLAHIAGGTFSNNVIANKVSAGTAGPLGTVDGNGWESEGVGVLDFLIEGNRIYNWPGTVAVPQPANGTPLPVISNVDFIDNDIQETAAWTSSLLTCYSASTSVNSFTGTRLYRASGGSANVVSFPSGVDTVAEFISSIDATGENTQVTYTAPSRATGDVYADHLNGGDDYADLLVDIYAATGLQSLVSNWRGDTACTWIAAGFDISAADEDPPTIDSITVSADGSTVTFVLSEIVTNHAGLSISMTGGSVSLTYESGEGSEALVYSSSRTIYQGQTGTGAASSSDIEDAAANTLANVSGVSVTNNSTQTESPPGSGNVPRSSLGRTTSIHTPPRNWVIA